MDNDEKQKKFVRKRVLLLKHYKNSHLDISKDSLFRHYVSRVPEKRCSINLSYLKKHSAVNETLVRVNYILMFSAKLS